VGAACYYMPTYGLLGSTINNATLYADASHDHSQCKITNLEFLDMTLDVLNVFVSATGVQNNIDVFAIYLAHLQ